MTPEDRERILSPALVSGHLPGIGGGLRACPEDFIVHERPAYEPDGREERHILVWLKKRNFTTGAAIGVVAQQLELPREEIGHAGLKDKLAVTTQRISIPWEGRDRVAGFSHPDIELSDPQPHGTKLRRGHLAGNSFEITVRELACDPAEAQARVTAKLSFLSAEGGFDNIYGAQRFGHEGRNLERGIAMLSAKKLPRHLKDFEVSAAQSGLFNLVSVLRRERGLARQVLLGDVLKKTATGGLFTCEDPQADQVRLDAGELVITGPMIGGKSMRPGGETPAGALEREACERCGLDPDRLESLGKQLPGARRPLQVQALECEVLVAPPTTTNFEPSSGRRDAHTVVENGEDVAQAQQAERGQPRELGPGLRIRFALPSGSYATTLLRELMGSHLSDLDEQVT